MHEDQVDVDIDVVRGLLAQQRPDLAGLPITPVASTGTVNALFRIGDDLVARLPLTAEWSADIEHEWRILPRLAERITTVRVPEPEFKGEPDTTFPFTWSIYRWIKGSPYEDRFVDDEPGAARTLARFVLEMRSLNIGDDAPPAGRDPLRDLDDLTREAIRASHGVIDTAAALAVWNDSLDAPAWDGERVWIHTDLLRPNLLVEKGRLVAVIDFGGAGVGDPASDLTAAWATFGSIGRRVYRAALQPDDGEWSRGRGIALHQAALIIPYYAESNPAFVELARRTIEQIIDDA